MLFVIDMSQKLIHIITCIHIQNILIIIKKTITLHIKLHENNTIFSTSIVSVYLPKIKQASSVTCSI